MNAFSAGDKSSKNVRALYLASDRYCKWSSPHLTPWVGALQWSSSQRFSTNTCGGKMWSGQPCSSTHHCIVAMLAFRTSCFMGASIHTKLFSQKFRCRINKIACILWLIRMGIHWCSVRKSHKHTQFSHPYCFLIAKAKATPMKRLGTPGLELCATLLVIKLLCHCGKIVCICFESRYA